MRRQSKIERDAVRQGDRVLLGIASAVFAVALLAWLIAP
jgi:hypothetical protein